VEGYFPKGKTGKALGYPMEVGSSGILKPKKRSNCCFINSKIKTPVRNDRGFLVGGG